MELRCAVAYVEAARILGASLLDGNTALAERNAADLLMNPAVALLHVRAVEFGCSLFEIRR